MAENDDEQARSSAAGVSASLTRPGGLSYLEIPARCPPVSSLLREVPRLDTAGAGDR